MEQVVQNVRNGATTTRRLPAPICLPGHVIIANAASLISAGTERYVVELARKSVIGKLWDRPDHLQRLLQKVRQEGLTAAMAQAHAKLDEPMPLGYSSAGIVLECGQAVQEFKPGDMVAAAAPHAGVVCVGRNLCARIPEGVSFEQAAYTAVAAVALQGLRLAQLSIGANVLVIGLGLIGQISVALAKAQGCKVFASDIDISKLALARSLGADEAALGSSPDAVKRFSGCQGVDAAIITAATKSNEPIEFAAEACRSRGRIVLVGVTGLQIPRAPFFKKELEFTVSSSLGPGRGDSVYEEKGIDYPIGHARWTAQRNMQTVLDLIAANRLPVDRLTTHRFPIEEASQAYDLITSRREPYLGILLEYQMEREPSRHIALQTPRAREGEFGVSMIGAGNFARLIMMPALRKSGAVTWRGLCTARGLNAEHSGRRMGFEFATTDVAEIWNDQSTRAVFVATRHDLHADLIVDGLRAGKHVFVEKPLCITEEQLERIRTCVEELGPGCPLLMVGFNRRFAPATESIRTFFSGIAPVSISYRFATSDLPRQHWAQDEEVGGGRIVGEACHAIDTCVAIAGSVPIRVVAESVAATSSESTTDDRVFIVLRHANGSVSSICYQSQGDAAFPPERIEVFGGGRTAVNDSWRTVELWNRSRCQRLDGRKDRGHEAEFGAFLAACRNGGAWPICWDEMYQVTWASLAAVRSLREGFPIYLSDSRPSLR
jgi:predicted dehydrogenase/threonine dehydrogenase-like Zn-dependent dehydrogenase